MRIFGRFFSRDQQLQLFGEIGPVHTIETMPGCSHEQEAEKFHALNPAVYLECVRIARELAGVGFKHYGMKAIWELVRFECIQSSGKPFTLSNNYHAWYARRIMLNEPDLAGFFVVRETRGA